MSGIRGLPLGGHLDNFDTEEGRAAGRLWLCRTTEGKAEPIQVAADRIDYTAPYNSTSQVPSGPAAGVATAYGRVWAEGRSLTNSAAAGGFGIALISAQNGVRAIVTAPSGSTITGGSVRFWLWDPVAQVWALGGVEETLATGAQVVATTDQFVTVGAQ